MAHRNYIQDTYSHCNVRAVSEQALTLRYGMKSAAEYAVLEAKIQAVAQARGVTAQFSDSSVGEGRNWFDVTFRGTLTPLTSGSIKDLSYALLGEGCIQHQTRIAIFERINRPAHKTPTGVTY